MSAISPARRSRLNVERSEVAPGEKRLETPTQLARGALKSLLASASQRAMDRLRGSSPSAREAPATSLAVAPIALIDDLLVTHAHVLGSAYTAYRNHAQRVALTCESLAALDVAEREQVHIAAAFHDLGIWTHDTLDYLAPSMALASEYLERTGRAAWQPQVVAMIEDHHRLRAPRHALARLSEIFRRADMIDLACVHGAILHERPLEGLAQAFPNAGFHVLLTKLAARQLLRTPWNPLPFVRL